MNPQFQMIYTSEIKRDGALDLLMWLDDNKFFEMPASTRFHNAHEGGLAEHSMNVYHRLNRLYELQYGAEKRWDMRETLAIVGLVHDVVKAGLYAVEYRNRKNDQGQWEKYPVFVYNDPWCFGHGEGSVILISRFMKLTDEEMLAIRWHMGFSDATFKGGSNTVGDAFNKCPLAVLLNCADLQATYLDEVGHGAL